MELKEEIKYPVRINKYLALQKICARREADELIVQGKVKINGRKAVLGDKVNKNDKVVVENFKKKFIYLAFNKPRGVITHSPQEGEPAIKDVINFSALGGPASGWDTIFPLGRLDKDSSGLIILTNDGRITDRLLNPKYEHEKEYIVKIKGPVTDNFLKRMSGGIKLDDGYITKECEVQKISNNRFSIILTEGKKHQIRRMCDKLGQVIADLKRVRVMNIKLGSLQEGDYREIKGAELKDFLNLLEL